MEYGIALKALYIQQNLRMIKLKAKRDYIILLMIYYMKVNLKIMYKKDVVKLIILMEYMKENLKMI